MIDSEGFRANVGIIVCNESGQLLWTRRAGQNSWQFPQGGVHDGETADETMFRELYEEIGLSRKDVKILGSTTEWLKYRLPTRYIRHDSVPLCIGQKQKWYLLRFLSADHNIRLDLTADREFDHWQWVSYWYPLSKIVAFKREVYRCALKELSAVHSKINAASPNVIKQ